MKRKYHALENHEELSNTAIINNLWIDGTADDDTYQGDATSGPWVVFDISKQHNIAGPFVEAEDARTALVACLKARNAI
jgi:hypothetical protein